MNRAGHGRDRRLTLMWSLLGAALLILMPVADCALVDAGTHAHSLATAQAAAAPTVSAGAPVLESAHCAPYVVDVIRASGSDEPSDRGAFATATEPVCDFPASLSDSAACGVRGPPPRFAVGGRALLTRLCIARR
ncbi:hypothetical protein [Nocardia sp. NPDC004722]